jgi:hypothetical protein
MKKKLLLLLLLLLVPFVLTACGDKEESSEKEEEKPKAKLEADHITIDGVYVDESYDDENLAMVYIFYTAKSGDSNLSLSSVGMHMKVNDKNDYGSDVYHDAIPKYTNYYYSSIIKKLYVGQDYKMCSTIKVAKGDLEDSKSIKLTNTSIPGIEKIKFTTDDIKKMDSYEKIAEDLDKDVYSAKYGEEQDKLQAVDADTEKKVKNDINGYYFEGYVNIGQTISKCKVEFFAPNKFEVTNGPLSNDGTYQVKKGYITLDYGDGPRIFLAYAYEDGDIVITNLNEQFGTLTEYDPLGEDE